MFIDFNHLLATLLVIKPCTGVLSVYIGAGGYLCPICLCACWVGMALQQLMTGAPSLASPAEGMTTLMILSTVKMDLLLAGYTML